MKPLISIISVNYKQALASRDFLLSCQKLSYPAVEMILVDNAPDSNFLKELQAEFPKLIIIPSEQNLGFAGGNNLGIQAAKGEYLLFVNNDTLLTEHLLESLLEGFQSKENVGIVCPKIKFIQPENTIQFAGYTPINPYTGRNKTLGIKERDVGQYEVSKKIPYAHGAAMMVKRAAIDRVGLMPELFFLYYEELDWSEAFRKASYEILYLPKAVVYHHASLSTGQDSPLKTYYYYRNRILFMRRNVSPPPLVIFLLYFYLILTPAKLLIFLVKGKIKHAKALLQAISWHFRNSALFL